MKYLCIDPGPIESGFVILDEKKNLLHKGIERNLPICNLYLYDCNALIIEMIASYGMPVGKSTFDTVLWIGKFIGFDINIPSHLITRKEIKKTISSGSAKDANIRQALIDRYPAIGGGKTPQIGTKKQPGPLYGMKSHCWAALSLGHAYLDGCKHYEF